MKVTLPVTGSPWPAAVPRVALSSSCPDASLELKLVPAAGAMVTLLCCRARPFCAVTLYSPAGMTISGCASRPTHSGACALLGVRRGDRENGGGQRRRRIGGARLHLEDAAVEVDAHLRRRIGRNLDRLAYPGKTEARFDVVGAGL